MKITSNKITRLSDDIRQIFVNTYSEKSEMVRLCRDHRNPFLFNDKKPVLNITQDEFVGIFNVNSNHFFLPPDQSFRLGFYCNLHLPNLIALVMKAEWEKFSSVMSACSTGSDLKFTEQDLIGRHISDFKLNPGRIFNLFKDNYNGSAANITFSQIDFFINDLFDQNKFLIANDQISQQ